MKIELFDVDEFVSINNLEEITSPVLFERGGIPNPYGLISNEIFGVNIKSRKETFAYIDLSGHFIHPHIYKIIKRLFRNIDKIINGEEYYIINSDGKLIRDENGDTGIEFLYDNWKKIKWDGNGGMSSERADLISKSKINEIWISKEIVIPAFYRDINTSDGGGGDVPELDNMYVKLIRLSSLLKDRDMFEFSFHNTNYNIQKTLEEIYNYFKDKLDKKNGLLRKYLLGKNVDYCVRSVITAPTFNINEKDDNIVNFDYAGVPISQACVLAYPFVTMWLRNFFETELIENKYAKKYIGIDNDSIELDNPEAYFTDTFIKKNIDKYIKDPSSRYDQILVPTTDSKEHYMVFTGNLVNIPAEQSGIVNRRMTWTDLLFMACAEVTKNKHLMITRYPLLDNFGIFFSKMRIVSTLNTVSMNVNGTIYKWYPDINLNMSKHDVANNFIDTIRFSNAFLKGLDGDYDGDQITAKIIWTEEANEDCERVINSKSFILNPKGSNMRSADLEPIQSVYVLTKDPD